MAGEWRVAAEVDERFARLVFGRFLASAKKNFSHEQSRTSRLWSAGYAYSSPLKRRKRTERVSEGFGGKTGYDIVPAADIVSFPETAVVAQDRVDRSVLGVLVSLFWRCLCVQPKFLTPVVRALCRPCLPT